jgi:SNF2 family DNA or RNA helicase
MKLHDYQQAGVDHLTSHRYGALFWAPGMGKTLTTLSAIRRVRELGRVPKDMPVLIVAPLMVAKKTWPDEVRKWFPDMKVHVLHGKGKTESALASGADIYVINYDGLTWLLPLIESGAVTFAGVVFDELTKLKATSTKRFRSLRKALRFFRFRWGLTGTPAPNSMMEVFGQVYVLDEGARLGKYITRFREDYCYKKGLYEWVVRSSAVDQIREKIRDICLHLDAADYLDLPPRTDNVIGVELPANARAIYRKLEADLYANLGDAEITIANAATLVGKLQQIAQGFAYDDLQTAQWYHESKLDALEDLFDELQGDPLMVVYRFKADLEALRRRFPEAVVLTDDVERNVDAFNRGEIPMLLVQPQSAGHGLNLQQACSTVCWYALDYSLERYIQANGRVDRQGQTRPVVVHHLVAEGTVDETIMQVLRQRDADQRALLAGLVRRIREVRGDRLVSNA